MTFEERIKQLRKENHMTQDALAKVLNMSKGTVAMWEAGTRRPSFEVLERLSDIFDKKTSYILGESDDDTSPQLSEDSVNLLGKWAVEDDFCETVMKFLRLDDRGKRAVEALINEEFNHCRSENTLLPREEFLVSVRVRP